MKLTGLLAPIEALVAERAELMERVNEIDATLARVRDLVLPSAPAPSGDRGGRRKGSVVPNSKMGRIRAVYAKNRGVTLTFDEVSAATGLPRDRIRVYSSLLAKAGEIEHVGLGAYRSKSPDSKAA
jgi:hypothetical protein